MLPGLQLSRRIFILNHYQIIKKKKVVTNGYYYIILSEQGFILYGVMFILIFLENNENVTKGRKGHKLKVMLLYMILILMCLKERSIMEPSLIIEKILI